MQKALDGLEAVEIGANAAAVNRKRAHPSCSPSWRAAMSRTPGSTCDDVDGRDGPGHDDDGKARQYSPPVPEPTARPPPGATLNGVVPSPAAPITE